MKECREIRWSEIQRAHDILHFMIAEKLVLFENNAAVRAGHDALAWVLGFECGEVFADNVRVAEESRLSTQKILCRGGYINWLDCVNI
jgi:hypothetical protein